MSAQFRAADPHFRASSFVRPTPPTPTGPPPQLFIGNWSSNRCRSPSPANGLSDGKQYLLSHHPSCVPHPRALHSRHPMGDESLISGGHHSNRHGILIGIINSLSFPSVCVCVSQPFRLGKIAEMETANDQSDSRFASRDRYLVLGKENLRVSFCNEVRWEGDGRPIRYQDSHHVIEKQIYGWCYWSKLNCVTRSEQYFGMKWIDSEQIDA